MRNVWQWSTPFQVSIQVVIDIGNCILASLKENDVETHTDLIETLRKKKIISPECKAEKKAEHKQITTETHQAKGFPSGRKAEEDSFPAVISTQGRNLRRCLPRK